MSGSETAAPALSTLSDEQAVALVAKHRLAIDRVKLMDVGDQQQAFRDLGVDPLALEGRYADLQRRDAELRGRSIQARNKAATVGWGSFVAGFIASLLFFTKERVSNMWVRRTAVAFFTLLTGSLGIAGASRFFTAKINEQGKQLSTDAKDVFEKELAVALERREREQAIKPVDANYPAPGVTKQPERISVPEFAPQAIPDSTPQPAVSEASSVSQAISAIPEPVSQKTADSVPQQDSSFVARNTLEKAMAIAEAVQRS